MSGAEYRVNKATGQVVKDDGTGWKPVASVRNKTTGEILIDEGNGWQPMPGSQRPATPDPAMTNASLRANAARASGQRIAQDDLTQLGKLDLSTAAMARLPAPTMTTQQLDAFDAQRAAEKERLRVPDSNFKERLVIGSNVGTFGHGPQAMAGASTIGALLATPFVEGDIIDREGVSGAMSSFLDDARVHQRRGREERPIESYGGEIVGGLLQGKTLIDNIGRKVLPKTNTASNVARVMGTGAGYGSLYGFGQSESDNIEGALGDAALGGAVGAGTGLAFKAAEPAITAGYRAGKTGVATLSDALSAALGKAGTARDRVAEDVAIAAVRRSMQRSGMTFDEIMEQVKRYEGKPAVLAEVIGQDAVNALTALTRRPGATPQKAQAIIEERTFARPERMRGDVEDATGIPIGQLDETLGKQLEERQAAAKPLYDALYKRFSTIESFRQPGQTGQVMKRINRLARTPLAQRHLQLAKDAVATIAARRGIAVSKMSKMEYWDLVKRSLDDAIDSAKAKGEARTRVGEGIEDLVGLKNDLVDELDRLTGGAYAAAREVGGEAPRLKAAAVAGQKVMQARNPREVAKTVAATLSQDLPALRAGVVDDLGTRIDKGMLPSRVRVPDVAGKLRASLGEESANKLINKFDAEAALAETGSRWAPRLNSVTGTVMESGATAMGDDLINAGFNLATGNKVGLLRQAINFMRQRGFSQRQIDAIGDLLLSSPEEGLKRLRVMAPDGVPTGAAAPLSGGGGGGDLPPGGGAPVPTPTPASPIRAGGFAGARPDAPSDAMWTRDGSYEIALFGGRDAPLLWINKDGEVGFSIGGRTTSKGMSDVKTIVGALNKVMPALRQHANSPRALDTYVFSGASAEHTNVYRRLLAKGAAGDIPAYEAAPGEFVLSRLPIEELQSRFGAGLRRITPEDARPLNLSKKDRVNPLKRSQLGPRGGNEGILPGLRTDAGNALVGAGVGALGPADSSEERLRNMAGGALLLGAGGRMSRTVGRNALAGETRTAGVPPRGPSAKLPDYGYDEIQIGKASVEVTRVDDKMTINRLKVPENARGQGEASRALDAVLQQADEQGLTVFLTADPVGAGGLSKTQLEAFYKRHGFVPNKGRNKDFSSQAGMIRTPRSTGKPKTPQQAARYETPGSPEYEAALAKGLDMSTPARMARAKEMGFDTETVLYHGTTRDFDQFDLNAEPNMGNASERAVFLTPDPESATDFAMISGSLDGQASPRVMPLVVRGEIKQLTPEDLPELRRPGKSGQLVYRTEPFARIIEQAKREGFAGVKVPNVYDVNRAADQVIIFDPANIRSVNAAFDPDKAASPILTAGIGGGGRGPLPDATYVNRMQRIRSEIQRDAAQRGETLSDVDLLRKSSQIYDDIYSGKPSRRTGERDSPENIADAVRRMQEMEIWRRRFDSVPEDQPQLPPSSDPTYVNRMSRIRKEVAQDAANRGETLSDTELLRRSSEVYGYVYEPSGRLGGKPNPVAPDTPENIAAAVRRMRAQKDYTNNLNDADLPPIMPGGFAGGGGRGPRKPTVGKPKRDLGTKAADAAAIASLTLTPPAQAQGSDGSAELEAAKQRVTDIQTRAIPELEDQLRVLRDPKGDPFAKQEILKLRGYPLGTTGPRGDGVDGVIGQRTTQAIVDEAKKIEGDIEKRRKDLADARAGVTQLEMRLAQQEAEVGPLTKTLREVAPWAGTIAGLAIAGISRRGAVVKSRVAAQQAAARANALLNSSTKVSRSQRGADSLSTRASNLNEFWRLGGAGDNVPFKKTKEGKWTQRPRPMEPSRLFPPERNPIRSMDAGVMVGGLAEAGGSQMMIMDNQKKAAEARANIEKYAAKGDLAGVKRAQAQLEEAENMVALATAARNLGLGVAGGRAVAALKMPYAPIRPHINMAAAEDEQALLLSKMKK